jgi:hypothetical protein
MTGELTPGQDLRLRDGRGVALVRRRPSASPKISQKPNHLRQKRHSEAAAARDKHLRSGIMADFDDNAINGIVAFRAQG